MRDFDTPLDAGRHMQLDGVPIDLTSQAVSDVAGGLRFVVDAKAHMARLAAELAQMYRERDEALREVDEAHHDALYRLALAAEFRDGDTGVHIVRIGFLAEALALELGHQPAWAALLRKAAPMHDIGKIGIPDLVLKKQGTFTPDERLVMNQHAHIGAEILGRSQIPLFQLASEVALTHHERFDGRGYPEKLAGQAIALSGRIVSVVDFFDAVTMDRCYRPALSDATANEMLRAERGKAFDPEVIDMFLARWPRFIALRDSVTRLQPTFADLARGSVRRLESTAL